MSQTPPAYKGPSADNGNGKNDSSVSAVEIIRISPDSTPAYAFPGTETPLGSEGQAPRLEKKRKSTAASKVSLLCCQKSGNALQVDGEVDRRTSEAEAEVESGCCPKKKEKKVCL